jgi:anaerobic magnesium-protoporphyrin IX monomethyl ester cyclase
MFKRVMLIAPPSSSYLGAVRPPSNLGYLAQALLDAGIEYVAEDLRRAGEGAAGAKLHALLLRRLRSFAPDLIGISMVSLEYRRTYDLIRYVKQACPGAAVVVGGPHVSALGPRILEECPEIDFGVMQEGEEPLVQLCQGDLPFEQIPGLLYRQDGALLAGGPEPVCARELDSLSFPTYAGFDLSRYAREIPLVTSRGCPYRCIFCFHSVMQDSFRPRSAANVVDEIEYWYRRGIRQFVVDDDNFTLIKRRVYEICDEIERRGLKDLFIRCANGIRADKVDRDLLARMKECGVREVGFGADGGNDRVLLELVKKGESLETIERAIRDALAVGIEVRLFIILGHPGETMSDVEDSLALAQRYPLIRLHLNNPIPYPGTELFEWVEEHDCFLRTPEDYLNNLTDSDVDPVFETPELPAQVRRQINLRARKIEKQVWRAAAERMLAGQPMPVRSLAARLFATDFGEWLFFKNLFSRSVINRFWYRRMVRS